MERLDRLLDRSIDKKISLAPAEACLVDLIKASEPVNLSQTRKQRVLGQVLARQSLHRSWMAFLGACGEVIQIQIDWSSPMGHFVQTELLRQKPVRSHA